MFNFRAKSLATKLIAVTGGTIAVVLIASNLILISHTQDRVKTLVLDQAQVEAKSIAADIAGSIGALAGSARSMAGVIERGHDGGYLDRKSIIDSLKANLDKNAFAFGSWFAEAPNAFDGKAADYIDKKEFTGDKTGAFNPYWTKTKTDMQLSTFQTNLTAEWYALAANSGKAAMTQPYAETTTGDNNSMSSIAYPVMSKGKLLGVSGVDVSLTSLSTKLQGLHPFGTGRVTLLAQSGQWLVAPTAALSMKPYDGIGADVVKTALASGQPGIISDLNYDGLETFERIVLPFDLPDVNTRWVVLVDVPYSAINGPVMSQTTMMAVGGVIVLIVVLLGLFLAVRSFVQKPLASLVRDVRSLSNGVYTEAVAGQDRDDETGAVAKALEGFRHQLADTRRLSAEAQQERQMSEQQRTQSETERAATSELQRQIVATLANGLSHLASGDLGFRINDNLPAEYMQLKIDFNAAMDSLEDTIRTVNGSVGNIGNGTGEISTAAKDLSHRTEQQAASLEETAAALDELTSQVNASADHAKIAARTVESASSDAEQSGDVVQQAVAAMKGIEQSSGEISRIISVIDEIAFQTNLLALNAGVEAARAGDAGKGFAVVAQEVRELAQRSANAAKEIKTLINASASQVSDGVNLVGRAGNALHKISEQVVQINGLIRQIAGSASEQAVGLKEINAAVNQMDQVTQQNAAMVEQTTAASMTLNDEAQMLSTLVSRFQVRGEQGSVQRGQAPTALRQTAQRMRAPSQSPSGNRNQPAPAPRAKPSVSGANALATDNWEEF